MRLKRYEILLPLLYNDGDVPESENSETFFRQYKEVLKERFKQIDIWITSYEIDVI